MSFTTILAVDSDKWAAQTYRANFPDVDMRTAAVADVLDELPDADIILGGFPCQPHSLAGKRLASSDERDGGADFVAAIARVKPRMFLGENVPGLLSSEGGRYFRWLVGAMEGAGYVVQVKLLDAVNFGVPQFRKRIWFWGIRRDLHVDGIRHKWPLATHAWPPPEASMFGETLLPGVTVGEALGLTGEIQQPRGPQWAATARKWTTEEPSPSVTAGSRSGGGETLRIVGGGRNDARGIDGNFVRHERDITNEPCTTIAGKFMGTHAGAQNARVVLEYDHGVAVASAPSPTLKAGGNYDQDSKQGGGCPPVVAYRWSDAMLYKHPPASPASPAPTVQAKYFKGGAEGLLHWKQTKDGLFVRRLSPIECLRLQSGPDDFAWPDGIGKTAMYRIIGNGWASRMGQVMGDALALADPHSLTVIDLYCGGGIGAVGFHGRAWACPVPHEQPVTTSG